jgi:hypothetical protein
MSTFRESTPPVNAAPADDLLDLVEDPLPADDAWLAADCARDLRQWHAATAACPAEAPPVAVLLAWARATLPAPVLPCVCTDGTCLRCRVAAVVGDRRPAPADLDRLVDLVDDGDPS